MAVNEQSVREALARVPYPGFQRDIVSFGVVKAIRVDGGKVAVRLEVGSADLEAGESLVGCVEHRKVALESVAICLRPWFALVAAVRQCPDRKSSSHNHNATEKFRNFLCFSGDFPPACRASLRDVSRAPLATKTRTACCGPESIDRPDSTERGSQYPCIAANTVIDGRHQPCLPGADHC
jgi:hypothetical protein